MTDRIKKCPLCGGKTMLDRYEIFCDNCYLSMNFDVRMCNGEAETYQEAKEQAIEAWNTRKPMDRIVEKLEDRIDECGRLYDYFGNHNTYQVEGYRDGMYKAIEIVKGEQNE